VTGCIVVGESTYRVLIVDDEALLRKVLSSVLVNAGYVVRTAVDGIDGIGKLRGSPIDLLITDLQMPRMSGVEFLAVVRQRHPHLPVIALSNEAPGRGLPEHLRPDLCFQENADGFESLLKSVSGLLRDRRHRGAGVGADSERVLAAEDGKGHYHLTCGECLRTFELQRGAKSWRGGRLATSCPHCGGVVRFSVATSALAS
jgi:CheY-like chemotaxis protein